MIFVLCVCVCVCFSFPGGFPEKRRERRAANEKGRHTWKGVGGWSGPFAFRFPFDREIVMAGNHHICFCEFPDFRHGLCPQYGQNSIEVRVVMICQSYS